MRNAIEKILIGPKEAEDLLGFCERKQYDMRKRGMIPYMRDGRTVRYSVMQLQRFFAEQCQATMLESRINA